VADPYRQPSPRVDYTRFDNWALEHEVLWGCTDLRCCPMAVTHPAHPEPWDWLHYIPPHGKFAEQLPDPVVRQDQCGLYWDVPHPFEGVD
jgi:hypothetical protein